MRIVNSTSKFHARRYSMLTTIKYSEKRRLTRERQDIQLSKISPVDNSEYS